jgi:hypothetical protein
MKKVYATPELLVNGEVTHETLSGPRPGSELAQPALKFNMTQASLGFYL